MGKRIRQIDESEDVNVWSAFTDLMSNAFMIILLLFFMVIATAQIRIFNLSQAENKGIPPFIEIKDSPDFRFRPNSASISDRMEDYIKAKIVPLIDKNTKEYGINIVEIIGHTDEQPLGITSSNLDRNLETAATNSVSSTNIDSLLKAGSNVDLGLMRSLAVVKLLQRIQQTEGTMAKVKFRPYSAAQLILPNGNFADPPGNNRQSDDKRRRIEIRFTRLGQPINP